METEQAEDISSSFLREIRGTEISSFHLRKVKSFLLTSRFWTLMGHLGFLESAILTTIHLQSIIIMHGEMLYIKKILRGTCSKSCFLFLVVETDF